jgi:hypothetical protein
MRCAICITAEEIIALYQNNQVSKTQESKKEKVHQRISLNLWYWLVASIGLDVPSKEVRSSVKEKQN